MSLLPLRLWFGLFCGFSERRSVCLGDDLSRLRLRFSRRWGDALCLLFGEASERGLCFRWRGGDETILRSGFSLPVWAAMRPSPVADVFSVEIDRGCPCASSASATYYLRAKLADLHYFCPIFVLAVKNLNLGASPLTECSFSPFRNRVFQSSST